MNKEMKKLEAECTGLEVALDNAEEKRLELGFKLVGEQAQQDLIKKMKNRMIPSGKKGWLCISKDDLKRIEEEIK